MEGLEELNAEEMNRVAGGLGIVMGTMSGYYGALTEGIAYLKDMAADLIRGMLP